MDLLEAVQHVFGELFGSHVSVEKSGDGVCIDNHLWIRVEEGAGSACPRYRLSVTELVPGSCCQLPHCLTVDVAEGLLSHVVVRAVVHFAAGKAERVLDALGWGRIDEERGT